MKKSTSFIILVIVFFSGVTGAETVEELINKGNEAYKARDYDTTIKFMKKVIVKEPDNAGVRFFLGFVYDEKGMLDEAISELKKAIAIDPNDLAYGALGVVYRKKGMLEKSISQCKMAIILNPNNAEVYYNLGVSYGEIGKLQDEIHAYKQATNIKPDYADAYYNLGISYEELGKYKEAVDTLKQAIKVKPDFTDAYYNLGTLYAKKNMLDEAILELRKVIDIDPNHADAYYNLGCVYNKKGLMSTTAKYLYKAGILYLKQGNKKGALNAYERLKLTNSKELERALFEKLYPELE